MATHQIVEVVMRESLLESALKVWGPLLIAAIGIIVGYHQFKRQLNRSMCEKRLSEVYAPLIGLIAKQEFFRQWYPEELSFESAQIIELVRKKEQHREKTVLQKKKWRHIN